jgi:hypothetical protein
MMATKQRIAAKRHKNSVRFADNCRRAYRRTHMYVGKDAIFVHFCGQPDWGGDR